MEKSNLLYKSKNKTYQNGQKYSECQLISSLNAAYHLGEKLIHPDSEQYERLIDVTGGRYGACIAVEDAYRFLRLVYMDVKPEFRSIISAMSMNLPIGISVDAKRYGLHSVLIIEVRHNNKKGGYDVRVPNLRAHTNRRMWIYWEKFEKMIYVRENITPECGFFRIYYLDPLFQMRKQKEQKT